MNSLKIKDLESYLSANQNITVAEYLEIFNKNNLRLAYKITIIFFKLYDQVKNTNIRPILYSIYED